MVWPSSTPSQMWLRWGARNQRACVLREDRMQVSGPPSDFEPGVAGSGHRVSALCCAGRRKIDRCRAPKCSEPEVAGSGHWTEPLVLLREETP